VLKGIGIDIIEVERVWRAYRRRPDKFLKRFFTLREQKALLLRQHPAASLAARFAAKEAVAKALGTGIGKVAWTELEIMNKAEGGPSVLLSGRAAEIASKKGISHIHISLAHEKSFAVACAVALGESF